MIIQFILLTLPLITHLIVDWHGVVRHKLNAAYVLALSVAVGILLPGYWWQGTLFALAIHFTFFDPLYNLMHRHAWNYHGDPLNPKRALTDKIWASVGREPIVEILARAFVLFCGYSVYFELDRIISYT